ncbi:MAG: hypothetical protein JXL20_04420 [Deltaproteobacteria bacterium]|nr:hypothetical protein [Deltaproteobacteria bacterium]MBN2783806.1 hypothetical protein [Pontiellaceae bacterium]
MKKILLIPLAGIAVLIGLRLLATQLPIRLDGSAWDDIEHCAENQKMLYQSIEWYVQENGKLPNPDFKINGLPAKSRWKCPACGKGYMLDPENYKNKDAVIISDELDQHSTTFMWWFRGLHPQVQTMGDGTIQLFKGGKILTMSASRK